METNTDKEQISRIAPILKKRAEELGFDLYDISDSCLCTYEYARRLLAGTSIPTSGKIMDIVQGLRMDPLMAAQIEKLAEEDRLVHDKRRRENRSPKYPRLPGTTKQL